MVTKIKNAVLLTEEEYEKLTNPDVTYTIVTKTSANKIVNSLLKHSKFVCWHDDPVVDLDGFCCSECPVGTVLGDAGYRLCLKQKAWRTANG